MGNASRHRAALILALQPRNMTASAPFSLRSWSELSFGEPTSFMASELHACAERIAFWKDAFNVASNVLYPPICAIASSIKASSAADAHVASAQEKFFRCK